MNHDRIYKRDSQGRLRTWFIEQDGSRYRVHSGLVDGTLAVTGWTQAKAASQSTDEAQANFEIKSAYDNKLTREYHRTIEATDGGAHFFKPMLAKEYAPTSFPVFAQPKLDGIRCITTKDGMFSRQGKPITAVPHIHAALAPLFEANPGLILDGELYNHDLKDDFGEISSIVRKAKPSAADLEKAEAVMQYHVYDVPSVGNSPFRFRADDLATMFKSLACGWIVPVETVLVQSAVELDELYGRWLEAGYEGQMVRLDALYEQKRSKSLLKRKEFQDAEYEVISIDEGNGNWAGVAKRVSCRLPDGRVFGAGIRGTRERAASLLGEQHKVVTVRFFALTPDGVPRFPVVTKFHGAERTL
ncbi:ATP-dependent DNA ligase [Sphingomonas jaspsi]|uniref:ATP-dependent DNA ligase n=1 Tax=Sphingomonas jaspsi TaxID=392409 RepID=UPI0004AFB0D2|nr:ATP-dependent DNA ligase [Sphingomonas jaspsi]